MATNHRKLKKFMKQNGWRFLRAGSGSHEIWCNSDSTVTHSIAFGSNRDIPIGTYKEIEKNVLANP